MAFFGFLKKCFENIFILTGLKNCASNSTDIPFGPDKVHLQSKYPTVPSNKPSSPCRDIQFSNNFILFLKQIIFQSSANKNYLSSFCFVFKHASLPRDACCCCLSCGTEKISWVTLDHLAYGQLTQHNLTDFVAPRRVGLFASLIAPQNLNLIIEAQNMFKRG